LLGSHILASFIHHQDNQYYQHFRSAQGSSLSSLVRTFLLRPFIIKTISIIITLEVLKAISSPACLVRTFLLRSFIIKTISTINTLEVLKAISSPAWFAHSCFVHSSSRQSVQSKL
jgi:hypothetical protein